MALFEVIKNNKNNNNLVWRYPKRNFNTGSTLIVNESEEALLFQSGKALDLFGAGKYTLSTNNIPLLRNLINLPRGFKTPFTCDIYFVDKSVHNTKWGTSSKLEFLEPVYNFPISIGACGELRFYVEDTRKLIIKLVGIKQDFDVQDIDDFFSSQIMVKVKSYLTNIIKKNKICIFEIDSKLDEISYELKTLLNEDFNDFGISLDKFFVTTILKPEEDKQYLEFKELYFKQGVVKASTLVDKELSDIEAIKEASREKIKAEAEAYKRNIEGYSYQEEKKFEIGKEVAKNDAIGQYTNMGIGLGVVSGLSSTVSDGVSKTLTGAFIKDNNLVCSKCGSPIDKNSKFCKKCGNSINNICSGCGAILDEDSVFCSKCGKRVE